MVGLADRDGKRKGDQEKSNARAAYAWSMPRRSKCNYRAAGMGSDGYLRELEKWTRSQWRSVQVQGWLEETDGITDLTGCAIWELWAPWCDTLKAQEDDGRETAVAEDKRVVLCVEAGELAKQRIQASQFPKTRPNGLRNYARVFGVV